MTAKTPGTRKAKGREFQQEIRNLILHNVLTSGISVTFNDGIHSTSMGSAGQDLKFFGRYKEIFPLSVEAKNHAVGFSKIYHAYDQAVSNLEPIEDPVVFFRQSRKKPLVALDAELFIQMMIELYKFREDQKNNDRMIDFHDE
jgi:hypothetical protein